MSTLSKPDVLTRDFVVVRVSKMRWRVAVVRMLNDKLLSMDFVSGKHRYKADAEEACKNWNESTYGIQYKEW